MDYMCNPNWQGAFQKNFTDREKSIAGWPGPPKKWADHAYPTIEAREDIKFFDTDCGRVVNNIACLRMIETTRAWLAPEASIHSSPFPQNPWVTRTLPEFVLPRAKNPTIKFVVVSGGLFRPEAAMKTSASTHDFPDA
ncbi:MAG TPA: hypothetical protein DIT13_10595 [Verrucomicrobiales bacterium]|nr:hypothetical protein [Verrucomicrobiales bacterium]HRJ07130.1 hypothetical protein [Prosthecobacter sp.]HRK13361.1 hypothetical protein [Prosthecobacter sp.]